LLAVARLGFFDAPTVFHLIVSEDAVGDEVDRGPVFGHAEDGALHRSWFTGLCFGGEVGEVAFEFTGVFDDPAFVEVGLWFPFSFRA